MRRDLGHRRTIGALCVLLVSVLAPVSAASAEENGLKVGSGRLHPSIEIGGDYDTRIKTDSADPTISIGGFILHLKPALTYSTASRALAFDLRASGDANLYPERRSRNLSYFGGDVDLSLDINPKGTVGLILEDRFAHSDRNSAVAIESGVRSILNEARVALPIRPGGGALEIIPSYTLQLEGFLTVLGETRGVVPGDLNYMGHRPNLQARWRFLPKTALVVDVTGDYRQYFNSTVGGGNLWGLYAKAGLSGLITPKLSLVVNAGYGRSFLAADDYNSVIGQAEVTFIPNSFTRLKVGYIRTFMPVPQLVWFGDNRVYGGGSLLLGGRLLFDFGASFDLVSYAGTSRGDPPSRIDTVVGFNLGLRGQITEWMEAGGGYRLDIRNAPDAPAGSSYQRHVVGIMVAFRY